MAKNALRRLPSLLVALLFTFALSMMMTGTVSATTRGGHGHGQSASAHRQKDVGEHSRARKTHTKKKVPTSTDVPSTKLNPIKLAPTGTGPLTGKVILLDPGHGGKDPGAEEGTDREKDINLAVGLKLAELLRAKGATVLMTRADDTFIPLEDRAGMSNKFKPDIFVSIHTNSNNKRNIHGVETYYWSNNSIPLAKELYDALVAGLNEQANWVEKDNLKVLDLNTRPASLAEVGYLSYAQTRPLLMQDAYRQKIAAALCTGIENYFKSHP